ncbi:YraN family protein [Polyangium sp. y55x31]|uniref:YraN family protein n=1 Tax=Polyangium sp. y55x31 TaxID=3042688 RepID=UPI00248267D0|nr:YraN family protein [Polyangium sp. y55x31]MDI1482162.1 YraN family protein [Polyangium sp. y55x31]
MTRPPRRPLASSTASPSPELRVIRPRDARHRAGARAEDAAADHFVRMGCTILGRNVRVGRAEIDLLVRDGVVIVVVEVRTRGPRSYQRALDSIDARKRARLRAAGQTLWTSKFARDERIERMRFDAVAVAFTPDGDPLVEHIKAAF